MSVSPSISIERMEDTDHRLSQVCGDVESFAHHVWKESDEDGDVDASAGAELCWYLHDFAHSLDCHIAMLTLARERIDTGALMLWANRLDEGVRERMANA